MSIPKEVKVDSYSICCFLDYINVSQGVFLIWDLQYQCQIQFKDVRFIKGQFLTHEEFINCSNYLVQLVISTLNNVEICTNPIFIDSNIYKDSSDNIDFHKTFLLTLIIDNIYISYS
jgi:hypothetical protein